MALSLLGCGIETEREPRHASGAGLAPDGRAWTVPATTAATPREARDPEINSAPAPDGGCEQDGPPASSSDEATAHAALLSIEGACRHELPLATASYETFVVGTVAETIVKQRFVNVRAHTIEAKYVFPLPHDGAVYAYSIRVQNRTVRGEMKRREEARALYDRAKQQGHTAGLLEQERPNIFTQRVANIAAYETVEVELRVVQPLAREHGRFELVLPTVVGPRYVPGRPIAPKPADSLAPDTDRVPDGARIAPMFSVDADSKPNVSITVAIEQGPRVHDVRSQHHDVELLQEQGTLRVQLSAGRTLANRDFALSWSEGGEQAQAALMIQPENDDSGYFTLTIEPPAAVAPQDAMPRELVFVVDTSGSMSGEPLATAKDAMRKVLDRLAPGDVFRIVQFSNHATSSGSDFLPNTTAGVNEGLRFVDAMQGGGGTEMLSGIIEALDMHRDRRRMRMVLFLTDGYIGNESEVFAAVRARLRDARLFSLGVGTSVNRYLLDGLARMGRGGVAYVSPGEPPDAVGERFFDTIDRPALTDVAIDWGGSDLQVSDLEPQRLPDLFAGRPVVVFGRYRGKPQPGEIVLRGWRGGEQERIAVQVDFARPSASSASLSAMWARTRIARLSDELIGAERESDRKGAVETITQLALEHRVMTQYTSFVAIDDGRVVVPTVDTESVQPLLPEAVSASGILGVLSMSTQGMVGAGRGHGGGGIGIGSIGTIGHGAGGGTESSGAYRGRTAQAATVRAGKPDVRGSLSRVVIRRVVHRHINELRFCYEQVPPRQQQAGSVTIRFTISPTGAVQQAVPSDASLKTPKLKECVAEAVRRWQFPAPEGAGNVVVTYPFTFSPPG